MAVKIINNIPNTTAEGKKSGLTTVSITLTADERYTILSASVNFRDGYYKETNQDFTIAEDGKSASWSYDDCEPSAPFTLSGETSSGAEPELTVTNNIANTTETHTYDGSVLTITVTSDSHPSYLGQYWRFINPTVNYKNKEDVETSLAMDVEVKKDYSIATATIKDLSPSSEVTIEGKFVQVIKVSKSLSNCTSTKEIPEFVELGTELNVELKANENTEFKAESNPKFEYYNSLEIKDETNLTISEDKTKATGTITADESHQNITIIGESFPVAVVGGNYGAINVYSVTLENLADFSTKRFFKDTGPNPETGTTKYKDIDLGVYVNQIKRIYSHVPVSSTDVIRCGNYNTAIEVKQPEKDVLTLDFGNVTIPNPNKDSTDYESEIQVFLPFLGFTLLPPDYVGKEINLTYIINVVTGNGVAKFSYNGIVFQVENVEPSQDVIYRTGLPDLQTVGGDQWNELLFYGTEPFVLFKWFDSLNKTGSNNDYNRGEISGFTGLNSFSDISTISAKEMLTGEQERIYTLLKDGVIIE